MLAIQIIIVAFVLFALSRTVSRFREGSLPLRWLVLWSAVWSAVAVAVILPQTTSWFARMLGVGRGVDAVIYLSIIFLFYLVFRVFLRLQKIDHDITLVVRELGLMKSAGKAEKGEGT